MSLDGHRLPLSDSLSQLLFSFSSVCSCSPTVSSLFVHEYSRSSAEPGGRRGGVVDPANRMISWYCILIQLDGFYWYAWVSYERVGRENDWSWDGSWMRWGNCWRVLLGAKSRCRGMVMPRSFSISFERRTVDNESVLLLIWIVSLSLICCFTTNGLDDLFQSFLHTCGGAGFESMSIVCR